jgi:6-phosphogluconolactonase
MRKRFVDLVTVCLSAAILAACGGDSSGLSAPMPSPGAAPGSQARLAQSNPDSGGLEYAYVANFNSNTVDAYTINPTTGALKSLGSVGGVGAGVNIPAIDPTGKFIYITAFYSGDIGGFAIKANSGALEPVAGSPFVAGTDTWGLGIDPAGKFVYATSYSGNTVLAYTINPKSGALKPVTGSPFATGTGPDSVEVDPTGKFAYVTNEYYGSGPGSVSAYTIDASTGTLTPITGSPFVAGTDPEWTAFDPTGKFAYVCNDGSNNISAYKIDPTSGALTPIKGSPFTAGTGPNTIIVDPKGKFVYAVNSGSSSGSGSVSAYKIKSTGALTQVAGSPFATGNLPDYLAIDPTSRFVYVANSGSRNVSAYTIDASTGALKPVNGSPFEAGLDPGGIATCRRVGRTCVPPTV